MLYVSLCNVWRGSGRSTVPYTTVQIILKYRSQSPWQNFLCLRYWIVTRRKEAESILTTVHYTVSVELLYFFVLVRFLKQSGIKKAKKAKNVRNASDQHSNF